MNILGRVFDVAGFAVNTVLGINLQPRIAAIVVPQNLIDLGWAIALFRRVIQGQIDVNRHTRVLQRQMDRLILFVIGTGQKHR